MRDLASGPPRYRAGVQPHVSGAFSGPEKRATIRAVRFPRDDLVQLGVCDYLDRFSQQGKYGLYVRDTNSLFKGRSADYKRPGHDLFRDGHVPVTWLYEACPTAAVHKNLLGVLTVATWKVALTELARMAGGVPDRIEVVVQPVWLRKKIAPPPPARAR